MAADAGDGGARAVVVGREVCEWPDVIVALFRNPLYFPESLVSSVSGKVVVVDLISLSLGDVLFPFTSSAACEVAVLCWGSE